MAGPDFLNALHTLAEHEARRPECPCGTPEQDLAWAQELERWERRHQELLAAAGKAPASAQASVPAATLPTQPVIPEVPMSKHAPRAAEERLDDLLARLANATKEAQEAPNKEAFKARQNQVHQLRFQIKCLAEAEGLEMPLLPAIPGNPFKGAGKAVPKKAAKPKAKADEPMPVATPKEVTAPPRLVVPLESLGQIQSQLRILRAAVWSLLADLERLEPEALATLGVDVGPLRLGAATAERLVEEAQVWHSRAAG